MRTDFFEVSLDNRTMSAELGLQAAFFLSPSCSAACLWRVVACDFDALEYGTSFIMDDWAAFTDNSCMAALMVFIHSMYFVQANPMLQSGYFISGSPRFLPFFGVSSPSSRAVGRTTSHVR
jgi:hypothetical protein